MSCEQQVAGGAGTTGGVDFWLRYGWVWHAFAAVTLAAVAVMTLIDFDGFAVSLTTLALLAFLGIWYATVGLRARGQDERWALLYFAGVGIAFPVLTYLRGDASFLLFYLVPQAFAVFARTRDGIAAAVLLQGAMGVAVVLREQLTGWAVASVVGICAVTIAVSALLGLFIRGIIRQSAQRADLIAELERTREELARERHEAGVRAERERLAAEIHDTLAQGFTSILMLSQAARAALRRAPDTVAAQLDVIEQTARESLTEARSLVTALTPAALTEGSLADALRRLADLYRRGTGLTVEVDVAGEPATPAPDRDVVLLRAAQETLHNVRKHAGAHRVAVKLRYDADGSALTVTDNGHGFDPDAAHAGYGLRGMRHRVEAQGGTLTLRSGPQRGTTVEIRLPEPPLANVVP